MAEGSDSAGLLDVAKRELKDASRFLFFSEAGTVLAASFSVDARELKPLAATVGDRDEAIKNGMIVEGIRFEVHRYHPPLVYGRTMGTGPPENSEGIALCKVDNTADGVPVYGLITYMMPNISARMVPILQRFCEQHLQSPSQAQ